MNGRKDDMSEPLVTIIVPVYKIEESFFRNCLDMLLNQGRDDFRIILVDDGSPDGCGLICDEYAQNYDIISVVHQENSGAAAARNTGIAQVATEWITFVDADDWVEADYIDTIYKYIMGEASGADMLMFDYAREFDSFKSEESLDVNTGYLPADKLALCRKSVFFHYIEDGKRNPYTCVALWSKVYRTDFLVKNDIRFTPEARKGQDRLFNAEALTIVSNIFYIKKLLYHYRCSGDSRTNRYDPNVPVLVTIELTGLLRLIDKYGLQEEVGEFFNCYAATRLYSCMRLSYFHPNNTAPYKERLAGLKKLANEKPFHDALLQVNTPLLNTGEKIFVFCVKHGLYGVCGLLVKARSARFQKRLR